MKEAWLCFAANILCYYHIVSSRCEIALRGLDHLLLLVFFSISDWFGLIKKEVLSKY